jgi:hypothetical protein
MLLWQHVMPHTQKFRQALQVRRIARHAIVDRESGRQRQTTGTEPAVDEVGRRCQGLAQLVIVDAGIPAPLHATFGLQLARIEAER